MKIVLYADTTKKKAKKLENKIHETLPRVQINTLNSIEHLAQKLCQPLNQVSVLVIWAASRDELVRFTALNSLFDNLRVILILPDREKKTIALGIQLNPSFMSYADNDQNDITSVLNKIQKVTKEN